MGMKFELEGAFNAFLEEHLEFTEEHKDVQPGPHKPRYSFVDSTAEEEFRVHSLLSTLSDKEIYFLYALMSEIAIETMMIEDEEE